MNFLFDLNELLLKIPKIHFQWRIDKSKLQKLSQAIRNENKFELNEFLRVNNSKWRELAFFICCLSNKKDFLIEIKDEMQDFSAYFYLSCLSGNLELVKQFHSLGNQFFFFNFFLIF